MGLSEEGFGSTGTRRQNKKKPISAKDLQRMYHKEVGEGGLNAMYALSEVILRPTYSEVHPLGVDFSTRLGGVQLSIPMLSAAMDTVTGDTLASVMSEIGGLGVIYRDHNRDTQLGMVSKALNEKWCLISNPEILTPNNTLEDAQYILKATGFSKIPVVLNGELLGILFMDDIAYRKHPDAKVSEWMESFNTLKKESPKTSFTKIRDRLFNEQNCTVLPIVGKKNLLEGLYFMKDFFSADPSSYGGKPLIGMAVGFDSEDIDRVQEAYELGARVFVLDSSHGNCLTGIKQTTKIRDIVGDDGCVIAGNVADIDGAMRLVDAGAHTIKIGIGPGSICTTSMVTGVGGPQFTTIREIDYMRRKSSRDFTIIADGGIETTGNAVVALAAGADAIMSGKWFVAASESLAYQRVPGKMVNYRGMASAGAIADRNAGSRYGRGKTAPEGVEGMVEHKGPLKTWIGKYLENMGAGFAHVGAKNISELHEYGKHHDNFGLLSSAGIVQNTPRVL